MRILHQGMYRTRRKIRNDGISRKLDFTPNQCTEGLNAYIRSHLSEFTEYSSCSICGESRAIPNPLPKCTGTGPRAVIWVRGFVNNFLRAPIACQGSREAAVQLWNSQKKFYKTSYPSSGRVLVYMYLQIQSVFLLVPGVECIKRRGTHGTPSQ